MLFLSSIWDGLFPKAVWEEAWSRTLLFLPRVAIALTVLIAFWAAGSALARLIQRLGRPRRVEISIINLLASAAKILMLIFGGISALGTLGIDVTALVAGLGLTGLALGLALKEIISNALSGILVIVYKPFRENDVIAVSNFEGTVRDINFRFTTLEAGGQWIYIPNAMVISNAVIIRQTHDAKRP